jgi:alpha-ketoglutarate-dependent taurine dioxygenase
MSVVVESNMLQVLDCAADEAPESVAGKLRQGWPSSKVFHIRGVRPDGDLRAYYERFFDEVGHALRLAEDATIADRQAQRTGEIWFEVRYDPDIPNAYRHSSQAQPLHTDGSYIPSFPNAGILVCEAMPADGGATTFVDAVDVVEALRAENPDLLARLESIRMPHARSGDRRVEPVVRYDGDEPLVNWNYYCVDEEADETIRKLREQFFAFLKSSPAVAAKVRRVKLSPGEAVIWKDDKVLHGRDSFDPEGRSARFLWKAALQVDA